MKSDLNVNFSKGENAGKLSGISTEPRILGMLEATYYKQIDFLSLFIGEISDVRCRNSSSDFVTKVFTR